ncbi:Alpha/Beta hydrolase protein [Truncatella angustata]|uniref:Alpha/Beta hydrolase protein n=1 Tax=Truncatella angustata TaxID=152316 RepID=A0A9P8UH44_9PEZI|nr:Alpha/Beta hydrolase protein [Truncatella angustata]KAH6652043.1 Alpha/Beta hydrolase protein [Truncatella angustata]
MSDFTQYGNPSKEWLAYASTLPAPPAGLTMAQRKDLMNNEREGIAAKGLELWKAKVELKDHSISTRGGSHIEARSYRPTNVDTDKILPAYIHLHGGGFFFGTLSSEDAVCARIATNAQVVVLNVNYRHTPEHVYPAAWDDTADAFEWLHDNVGLLKVDPNQVVMGGISAGAQLTASFALQQHLGKASASRPKLAGQVLMIPCLVNPDCYEPQLKKLSDPSKSSYEQNKDAAILPMSVARFFTDSLKIEKPQIDDLKVNPGNASADDVKGLPPTVFGIAGWDILRDEGLLWAKLLTEVGVATDVHLFPGLPHGFRRAGDKVADSERWDQVMEKGIIWALSKPVATKKLQIKTEQVF